MPVAQETAAQSPLAQATERRISEKRAGAVPAERGALHNLPAQPTPFVGREQELAEIGSRLYDPACRLLTLVGPGGRSKTRLVLVERHRLGDPARAPHQESGSGNRQ